VTREEAVAEIAMRVPGLPPERTQEILACADQDALDGGSRTEMLLTSYRADGVMPDETGWQVFGDVMSAVPDFAAKVAPIAALVATIVPLV
jgi:hypothetical protein